MERRRETVDARKKHVSFMLFGVKIEAFAEEDNGNLNMSELIITGCDEIVALERELCRANEEKGQESLEKKRVKLDLPCHLPLRYREKLRSLGGSKIKLVIEKYIYSYSMSGTRCWFEMPRGQILDHSFLSKGEKRRLHEEKGEMSVKIIEPSMNESELVIKKWPLDPEAKSWSYVLIWNRDTVSKSYGINEAEKSAIQIWSFRYGEGKLGMGLVKYELAAELGGSASSSRGSGASGYRSTTGTNGT